MERDAQRACRNARIGLRLARAWQVGFISAALVLCVAPETWAQDDAPTAEDVKAAAEEFDLGRRAFKAKDYIEAAEHFEAADARAPSPTALELALRSRDRAGQLDRAANLAALAEARHPDEEFTKKLAPAILKRAAAELHSVSAKCDSPCELVVNTKLVHGKRSLDHKVFIPPGKYSIRAGWSGGRTDSEEIEATAGGKSELSFAEPPEPEPDKAAPLQTEPTEPSPAESETPARDRGGLPAKGWSPVVFFVGAGLTAVSGVVTIWSGLDTKNNPGADVVRQKCVGRGEACPEYQEGRDKQLRTNVLVGVTATLGVATALVGILATDWSGGGTQAALAEPRRTPRKASAGLWRGVEPWLGVDRGVTLGGARGRF